MGVGMLVGGLALSALSGGAGIVQARNQKKELNARAKVLEAQAQNENARAYDAFRQGETAARQRSQRLAQTQGSNRTGFAGAGLLVGEGGGYTQGDVWETNANNAAQDIASITQNAGFEADQHSLTAAQMRGQANALRNQGKQGVRGALTKAGLGLAASFASWGLGEWGSSLMTMGQTVYQNNLFGADSLRQEGMDMMMKGSLIQSGGSILAGIGGGTMGQSLYDTGIRTKQAMSVFGQNRNRKRGGLLDVYGGF